MFVPSLYSGFHHLYTSTFISNSVSYSSFLLPCAIRYQFSSQAWDEQNENKLPLSRPSNSIKFSLSFSIQMMFKMEETLISTLLIDICLIQVAYMTCNVKPEQELICSCNLQ